MAFDNFHSSASNPTVATNTHAITTDTEVTKSATESPVPNNLSSPSSEVQTDIHMDSAPLRDSSRDPVGDSEGLTRTYSEKDLDILPQDGETVSAQDGSGSAPVEDDEMLSQDLEKDGRDEVSAPSKFRQLI